MIHELKILPVYFEAVLSGDKTFEIRDNSDRCFQKGDGLILKEYVPSADPKSGLDGFTGRYTVVAVTYVINYEQKPGFVVLGIKREADTDHDRLVRELDVLLNGEAGAAKQASLCDLVSQVSKDGFVAKTQLRKLAATMENVIMAGTSGSRGMRNFLEEAKKALDEVKGVL